MARCIAATLVALIAVLLGVVAASDLVLTALQFRPEIGASIPVVAMSIEIGCLGAIALLVARAARHAANAQDLLRR